MQKGISRDDWEGRPVISVIDARFGLLPCRQHRRDRSEGARRTGPRPPSAECETRRGWGEVSSAAVGISIQACSSVICWQPSRPRLAIMPF